MNLAGTAHLAAPRPVVFERLTDPHFFATCFRGCRDLVQRAPNRYAAKFDVKAGFFSRSFDVEIELVRAEPPGTIQARIAGSAGALARLAVDARLRLEAPDEAHTTMHYEIEVTLTGKLAALAGPAFEAKARTTAEQFVAAVRAVFA